MLAVAFQPFSHVSLSPLSTLISSTRRLLSPALTYSFRHFHFSVSLPCFLLVVLRYSADRCAVLYHEGQQQPPPVRYGGRHYPHLLVRSHSSGRERRGETRREERVCVCACMHACVCISVPMRACVRACATLEFAPILCLAACQVLLSAFLLKLTERRHRLSPFHPSTLLLPLLQ